MLKPLHEIILKDIILLDATRKADSLKRFWFVPLFLCRKELEKLTKQVFDAIGSSSVEDLENEFDKLLSYRRIQLLEALYKAVNIELNLRSRINAWKIILEKDFKESEQLQKVIDRVKEFTGIEIKTPEDIKRLQDYIQHKIAKHDEMYPSDVERPTVKLIDVINSVFVFMDQKIDTGMLLITFISLKEMAENKLKQSRTTENDNYERD